MSGEDSGTAAPDHRGGRIRRPSWRALLILYLILLGSSYAVRAMRPDHYELGPNGNELLLPDAPDVAEGQPGVRIVWDAYGAPDAPVIVLLHGNPGGCGDFRHAVEPLARDFRVLVPDLPGFGDSEHELSGRGAGAVSVDAQGGDAPGPWSSVRQAQRVLAWLTALGIERAHFVGFSASGPVVLRLEEVAPERVSSATLLAAVGVQELELFGSYRLNHAVHGLQLATIEVLGAIVPHFGVLDDFPMDRSYARWFYETDQRPLRGILERFEPPLLVLHGERDFLVPPAAAREHHRIAPHSELWMSPSDHFMLFRPERAREVAEHIAEFVLRAEAGETRRRAQARPERVAAAMPPFDAHSVPPAEGFALVLLMLLIGVATWVTEDLTCIAAGLLVAQGRIEFVPAVVACILGIFTGDLQLYFAGRWIGRPALTRRPLRWFLTQARVDRATRWFAAKGITVIFASRFMPGLRLPTYFAAGMLHTSFWFFAGFFLLAATVWTPILVGVTAWLGGTLEDSVALFERYTLPAVIALVLLIYTSQRLLLPMLSHRGRRLLLGSWRRKRRWEFWPPWVFYPPVVLYVIWLSIRHRSFLVLTCVNPGIPTGGLVGESKRAILECLDHGGEFRLERLELTADEEPERRWQRTQRFLEEHDLAPPLVLKPDVGQRGEGVRMLHSQEQLRRSVQELQCDSMLQEFADGPEFGLFYARRPGAERGEIISITEKRVPVVVGDGRRTVEQLILDDDRAVCMAPTYLALHAKRLFDVLPEGEELPLVELGTHCRGAVFLDGGRHATEELLETLERLSAGFEGFYFGRYDVRVPSVEALRAGRGLKVIELNGMTSEATHIYDPEGGLLDAYRTLFAQWRLAFEIAADNRARGAEPATVGEVARALGEFAVRRRD